MELHTQLKHILLHFVLLFACTYYNLILYNEPLVNSSHKNINCVSATSVLPLHTRLVNSKY